MMIAVYTLTQLPHTEHISACGQSEQQCGFLK